MAAERHSVQPHARGFARVTSVIDSGDAPRAEWSEASPQFMEALEGDGLVALRGDGAAPSFVDHIRAHPLRSLVLALGAGYLLRRILR